MEINDINIYKDFDLFFYYGYNDLGVETKSDIFQNLIQSKRSLFYNRSQDSAGIKSYENRPNGIFLHVNLPYDVVLSLAKRNTIVSDGTGIGPDRRVAVSQSTIQLKSEKGNVSVNIYYIPFSDFEKLDFMKINLG